MMRVCELTGKRRNVANIVSHAHNKTKKVQQPNLQWKRVFVPEKDRWIRMRLSTRAIRNINRMGLRAYCHRLGVDYDALVESKLNR
ncbi:MAG: 50S ribosomal protein L28 [Myxococcota bacterium]